MALAGVRFFINIILHVHIFKLKVHGPIVCSDLRHISHNILLKAQVSDNVYRVFFYCTNHVLSFTGSLCGGSRPLWTLASSEE